MAFRINDFRTHLSSYGEFAKADKFEVEMPIPQILNDISSSLGGAGDIVKYQCEIAELPGREISTIDFVHHGFTERRAHFSAYQPINFTFYCNAELAEKKLFDAWLERIISSKTGLVQYFDDYSVNKIKIKQYSQAMTKPGGGDGVVGERGFNLSEIVKDTAIAAVKDIGKSAIEKMAGNTPFGAIENIARSIPGVADMLPDQLEERVTSATGKNRKVYVCSLIDAFPVSVSAMPLSWSDDSILRLNVTFVYKKWESLLNSESARVNEEVDRRSAEEDLKPTWENILRKGAGYGVNKGVSKIKDIVLGKLN